MGQRHQAFVIARVRPHSADPSTPPKYRCIAAFHHQWCYGRLPLVAAHRFITQVKNKDHAEIILGEIDAIQGQYGRWGQTPQLPRVPCPFTAFLLATNWSVDLEDPSSPYASGVSFSNAALPADLSSGGGDNNNGISVVDVTDPLSPSYCFVSVGGMEADGAVSEWVPLTAKEYVRAYYPESDYTPVSKPESKETKEEKSMRLTEEYVQATMALLKDVKVVTLEMLAEAWPDDYKRSRSKTQENKLATDVKPEPEAEVDPSVLSLSNMTLTAAARHSITPGEMAEIEAMFLMPERAPEVKVALQRLSPFPDTGVALLKKLLEKELDADARKLDLSGFSLSSVQVNTLVSAIDGIETLDLSHNPVVTIDTVRVILTALPQLKRLVLLGCSTISSEDINTLLVSEPKLFYHLEALIHPAFLRELKDASVTSMYPNGFSYIGTHNNFLKACSLPFFTPSRVVQALTDILQPLCNMLRSNSFLQTSLAIQAAFASVRAPDQKWSERTTVIIPQLSLGALKGEGWAFILKMNGYSISGTAYAFLRVVHPPSDANDKPSTGDDGKVTSDVDAAVPAPKWEIHDLTSFLDLTAQEGRPRPTNEAVNKLQDILATLQRVHNMELMAGDEKVQYFGKSAVMLAGRLY